MVLYHIISAYHMLCCIEHRLIYHPDEKAVLIVPNFFQHISVNTDFLKEKKIFDEIYEFPYNEIPHNLDSIDIDVERAYKNTVPYDISDFEHIYNAGIHFYFSVYLVNNNIPFAIFEDGAGILSQGSELANTMKLSNEVMFTKINSYNLFDASNKLIIKKYCNLSAQVPGFQEELAEDFNAINNLNLLSKEHIENIIEFYKAPSEIDVECDSILFLTQHFANQGKMLLEEQIYLYQLFVDYFTHNKQLIIKLHPSDLLFYDEIFKDSIVIKEKFPSELLPYIFKNKPNTIATISSTGIHALKSEFKECISFDFKYEETFKYTHRYYFALRILKYLDCNDFISMGTDNTLIENLKKLSDIDFANIKSNNSNKSIIIDDYSSSNEVFSIIESLGSDEVIIFINSNNEYIFYDINQKDIFEDMIPIIIKKTMINDTYYSDDFDDIIYVYTKSKEMKYKLMNYEATKELKNVGCKLEIDKINQDKIRIKVLEGMLEATEQRLLYYINKEKNEEDQ